MIGITPQEDTLINMNLYNPRATKFLGNKNENINGICNIRA